MNKPLLFLLAAAMLCGCTKTTVSQISSTVSGKWYLAADTVTQISNGNSATTYGVKSDANYTLFNEDGSGLKITGSDSTKFNYTALSNKLTMYYPAYEKYGQKYAFAADTGTIRLVTPDKLYLYFDNTQISGTNVSRVIEKETFTR